MQLAARAGSTLGGLRQQENTECRREGEKINKYKTKRARVRNDVQDVQRKDVRSARGTSSGRARACWFLCAIYGDDDDDDYANNFVNFVADDRRTGHRWRRMKRIRSDRFEENTTIVYYTRRKDDRKTPRWMLVFAAVSAATVLNQLYSQMLVWACAQRNQYYWKIPI